MKITLLLLFFFCAVSLKAQSLGAERVAKLKSSVVRITVGESVGTGFFISDDGMIATCMHVVQPAAILDSLYNIIDYKPILIQMASSELIEAKIIKQIVGIEWNYAVAYDYCVLQLTQKPQQPYTSYKLGLYKSALEGDQIVTCGYPLGIPQQFISVGYLSTKMIDTKQLINSKYTRKAAWLDLTMNKGNSGGPILKLGKIPSQDELVGIATFSLNPYANDAFELSRTIRNFQPEGDIKVSGVSTNKMFTVFADAITSNSIGVSGLYSIDHLNEFIKRSQIKLFYNMKKGLK